MGKQAIEGAKRVNAFSMRPENIVIIGLDTDHKEGEHPLYDNRIHEPVNMVLAKQFAVHGWHGAATVRKDGKKILTVDGRQSIRAAREANKIREAQGAEPIECVLLYEKVEDHDAVRLMIVMNENRLQPTILDRARKALAYMKLGKSKKETADVFGVSVQTLDQWLKIPADCDAQIIKAIQERRVSASAAIKLSELSRDEQVAEFEKMEADGKLSAPEAERRAKNKRTVANRKPPTSAIRQIITLAKTNELKAKLNPEVIKAWEVMLGEKEVGTLKGCKEALREVGCVMGPA